MPLSISVIFLSKFPQGLGKQAVIVISIFKLQSLQPASKSLLSKGEKPKF